jgi:alkanesulfonate monooxygenase SsuD/methylene tetrahydromethanopterin reductase-like flavin-dependent oxidoreductase (luciferase family)
MSSYDVLSLVDHLPDPATGSQVTQADRINAVVDHAAQCEQLGFAGFNVGEHHFDRYIMPAPELVLSFIAARTSSIRLGTSVSLLANLDPVRFAEQLAVLDVLTGGRIEVTFARGASEATAKAFGTQSFDELRPKFDESLRLVLRLLTEERVTWSGEHRTPLDDVRLEPRPIQDPHGLIWVGGGLSTISADLAADLGLRFMLPSLFRWPEDYREIAERYRDRAADRGFSERTEVGFPVYVHVAKTSQEAKRRWRPYLESYRDFALRLRGSFGRPVDYESLLQGPAIAGSPAEVAERAAAINEVLNLDRQLFLLDVGGMPAELVAESTDLLADALRLADRP